MTTRNVEAVPDRPRSRRELRTAVVWDALCAALPPRFLDVLDAGGGTGGFAVPLAELGHRVTVVDPSPDSLAALQRRAADAGVGGAVRGVQGDAAGLREVVSGRYDVVLCHSVLELVDDPAAAIGMLADTLRPDGLASVLVANRTAAMLSRALAGRFDEAVRALDAPDGRWDDADAVVRRFAPAEIIDLLRAAGLRIREVRGVRVVTDLVPGGLVDADPAAADDLLALERRLALRPDLLAVAGSVHVLAEWGDAA